MPDGSLLRGDCANCFGLCCVALPFAASADFAVDKAAGRPCLNLLAGDRCGIHSHLRESGFAGCTVYDCFGAGQKVSQHTFGGRSWRDSPAVAARMFEVFPVVRHLHELLWYVTEALAVPAAAPLHDRLTEARDALETLTAAAPDALAAVDLHAQRTAIEPLLRHTSRLARTAHPQDVHPQDAHLQDGELRRADPQDAYPRDRDVRGVDGRSGAVAGVRRESLRGVDLRGADLAGADLEGVDGRGAELRGADLAGARLAGARLRAADLRGACLIAADLKGADLRSADLLGSDLRDARLAGADLTGALFLTQPQVAAAQGDAATRISERLTRPAHW